MRPSTGSPKQLARASRSRHWNSWTKSFGSSACESRRRLSLHIEGAILLPGDGSDVPLPLAVGGELRTEVPRDPLPKFTAIELPFVLVVGHDSGGGEA